MASSLQELRTWEEELTRAAVQQKNHEELLRRREQELAEREIDILERELNIILHQLCQEKPHVKKRMGKFRKHRLKLKDGNRISLPSGMCQRSQPNGADRFSEVYTHSHSHFPPGCVSKTCWL